MWKCTAKAKVRRKTIRYPSCKIYMRESSFQFIWNLYFADKKYTQVTISFMTHYSSQSSAHHSSVGQFLFNSVLVSILFFKGNSYFCITWDHSFFYHYVIPPASVCYGFFISSWFVNRNWRATVAATRITWNRSKWTLSEWRLGLS